MDTAIEIVYWSAIIALVFIVFAVACYFGGKFAGAGFLRALTRRPKPQTKEEPYGKKK